MLTIRRSCKSEDPNNRQLESDSIQIWMLPRMMANLNEFALDFPCTSMHLNAVGSNHYVTMLIIGRFPMIHHHMRRLVWVIRVFRMVFV